MDRYYRWYSGRQCTTPTPIEAAVRFIGLAGDRCGFTEMGEAYCWGNGYWGTLGDGNPGTYSVPAVRVRKITDFVQLAAGASHVCGLDTQGVAYCWGNNFAGQLGIGERGLQGLDGIRSEPTPVVTEQRFVALAAASSATCGLTSSDDVWCWGINAASDAVPVLVRNHSQ